MIGSYIDFVTGSRCGIQAMDDADNKLENGLESIYD
jgi:hypothetical protein